MRGTSEGNMVAVVALLAVVLLVGLAGAAWGAPCSGAKNWVTTNDKVFLMLSASSVGAQVENHVRKAVQEGHAVVVFFDKDNYQGTHWVFSSWHAPVSGDGAADDFGRPWEADFENSILYFTRDPEQTVDLFVGPRWTDRNIELCGPAAINDTEQYFDPWGIGRNAVTSFKFTPRTGEDKPPAPTQCSGVTNWVTSNDGVFQAMRQSSAGATEEQHIMAALEQGHAVVVFFDKDNYQGGYWIFSSWHGQVSGDGAPDDYERPWEADFENSILYFTRDPERTVDLFVGPRWSDRHVQLCGPAAINNTEHHFAPWGIGRNAVTSFRFTPKTTKITQLSGSEDTTCEFAGYPSDVEDRHVGYVWSFIDEFEDFCRLDQYFYGECRLLQPGTDHNFADNVDLVYLAGHGAPDGIRMSESANGWCPLNNMAFGSCSSHTGGDDLEYIVFHSCQVLQMEGDWRRRWVQTSANQTRPFSGLHMVMGFTTNHVNVAESGLHLAASFADNVEAGRSMRDAWYDAVDDTRWRVGWINNKPAIFYLRPYKHEKMVEHNSRDVCYGDADYLLDAYYME